MTSRGDQVNLALSANYRVDTVEALSFLSDVIRRVDSGNCSQVFSQSVGAERQNKDRSTTNQTKEDI